MYVFTFSFKLLSRKTFAAVLAAVAAVSAVIIINSEFGADSKSSAVVCSDAFSVSEYLNSFGVEIDAEEVVADEITVPEQFNDVYESYNKVQKAQGFDLSGYKGCKLARYTFPVTNYSDENQNVFAEVLLYDGVVVAADIYSTNAEGFIKALK